MIPKIIHYIWLGGKEEPAILQKCKASWQKKCPDYEIKRWDETNLDLDSCQYARQAYDAKKFAFASDYFRFQILEREGGIYLDIDVELLKSLDPFLENQCFVGFESRGSINPGLVLGAEANNEDIKNLLESYDGQSFVSKNGVMNLKTICERTFEYYTDLGLKNDEQTQKISTTMIYATEYFNPTNLQTQKRKITKNTVAIHHYNASWYTPWKKFKRGVKTFLNKITFGLFGKLFLKK